MDAFRNQADAGRYISAIGDDVERVFVQAALARAIGLLVADEEYKRECTDHPFDLLAYARAIHALVMNRPLVAEIFSGKYSDFDQIPDQF